MSIAVVVPAFEEEQRIARVITTLPEWVDRVVVVDDASRDGTGDRTRAVGDPRVLVLRNETNVGVGASIAKGYARALLEDHDVLVVMAGDGQMDPSDLGAIVAPVLEGRADYVKGNRFLHAARRSMPFARRAAGKMLGAATRATTGLVIDDSQCGFTALRADVARRLPLAGLWSRYGYPNDLLVMLARERFRVVEVPVRPVYEGQKSGVRAWHAAVVLGILFYRRFLDGSDARRGVISVSPPVPDCVSGSSSSPR